MTPKGITDTLWGHIEAWIGTPDWDASRAYLEAHHAELLTEEAAAALASLDGDEARLHAALLRTALSSGIDQAYEELLEAKRRAQQAEADAALVAALLAADSGDLLRQLNDVLDDEQFAALTARVEKEVEGIKALRERLAIFKVVRDDT